VAIARALAQEPDAILADEPTASLDPVRAASILELLGRINRERGITVVANIHSVEYARAHASRIIGLRDGRIAFDGGPHALTTDAVAAIYGEESEAEDMEGEKSL
jgi:phosphonate transport system ATP-binding protein